MASNLASELSGTQCVELVMRLGKAGLTIDKAKELMGDDKKMEEFVKNGLKKDPYLAIPAAGAYERYAAKAEGRAFSALVEYVQPSYADLKKMFDWVYSNYANARFGPIDACKDIPTETREIEFELVHLDKDSSKDSVFAELGRRGLRPALYEELLAFVKKFPELQRQFPIVALGSVVDRNGYPCVYSKDGMQHLYFYWFGVDWDDGRFLAVRK